MFRRPMLLILLPLALLLSACATSRQAPVQAAQVWHDDLFVAPAQLPNTADLFTLTPQMKRYVAERIQPQVRRKGAQKALVDALHTLGELRLDYDARQTRNAGEAFDERSGNCLSLVIMTAAFAQELNLHVRFQSVLGVPALEQNGEFTFVVGHVNLALRAVLADADRAIAPEQHWLTIDFLPGQDLPRQRTEIVGERRIRAMFMNNRAAEVLAQGRTNEAYWWLRGAHAQDPGFANLYNTLGVVYRRQGALPEAEQALLAARAMEPDNEHVLGNLAGVQLALGRPIDGRALATLRAAPAPHARFDAARAALAAGQLQQAADLLAGELGLTPRSPELHHWLAVAHARLGDSRRAGWHLERAAEYSSGNAKHAVYAGKLLRYKAELARQLQ